MIKTFDIEIMRSVDERISGWPRQATEETYLAGIAFIVTFEVFFGLTPSVFLTLNTRYLSDDSVANSSLIFFNNRIV